ncbi:DUF4870 domain-containing protein [Thiotrichales bacterium 19S11-10]|nr:DUF4870 domain-containing protein [Thiotrichales bacterium 19S11-10]MCF6806962.1 DUF4870 domain-containing protein [Thiotrichales bacterium 19S9-11]MCF6810931.1 DUF4870 domain-containing protein [Thiotrichales bacterium 19S9-12]
MIADEIKKLSELKDTGVISEEEFHKAKERLLGKKHKSQHQTGTIYGLNESMWCTFMHLSLLAGFIVPILGLAIPFALWIISKDVSDKADQTGRMLVNWIASLVIYFIASVILMAVFIGWLLLVALVIVNIAFIIIGATKAADGEFWRYPLSIKFLSLENNKEATL